MSVQERNKKLELTGKHYALIGLFMVAIASLLFLRANTSKTEIIAKDNNTQSTRNPSFQAKIDNFKKNDSLFGNSKNNSPINEVRAVTETPKNDKNISLLVQDLMKNDNRQPLATQVFNKDDFLNKQKQALYESISSSTYHVVDNQIDDMSGSETASLIPGYVLPMGSVVHVIARSENSNHYLGSPFFGVVAQDVYDFKSQKLLINKGATAVGHIDAVLTDNPMVETKLGIVIEKIKRSDGSVINFDLSASDSDGLGGISGDVNKHSFKKWGGFAAFAVLSSGLSLTSGNDAQAQSSKDEAYNRMKQQISSSSSQAANQFLQIKPTVTIHSGDEFSVMIKEDIEIQPIGEI